MTREELNDALLRFGGDLERWPQPERDAARSLVRGDAVAAKMLSNFVAFEQTIAEAVRSEPFGAAEIGSRARSAGHGRGRLAAEHKILDCQRGHLGAVFRRRICRDTDVFVPRRSSLDHGSRVRTGEFRRTAVTVGSRRATIIVLSICLLVSLCFNLFAAGALVATRWLYRPLAAAMLAYPPSLRQDVRQRLAAERDKVRAAIVELRRFAAAYVCGDARRAARQGRATTRHGRCPGQDHGAASAPSVGSRCKCRTGARFRAPEDRASRPRPVEGLLTIGAGSRPTSRAL